MEEKKLSLGEHLEELRTRLFYSAIIFGITAVICFIFQKQIIRIIIWPHINATQGNTLKAFNYPEGFLVYFKASLIAALLLSAPFTIHQLWKFIESGLYSHEKKHVTFYAILSLILFVLGVLFSYFVLVPLILKFLFHYTDPNLVESTINLNSYFNLILMFTLVTGIVFELPLIMLFLVQIKITTIQTYVNKIKMSILLAFIISAIITPGGDPISQTLFAVPLLLLYFLGILFSFIYLKLNPNPAKAG